jgi:hypothetical protein
VCHAELIRAATDEHIWSDDYDGELGDVLTLESEVAQSIARRVEVKVTGEERARLVTSHHVSPEVYESYLKAEDQFSKSSSQAELEQSIAYLEETIGKDANFAPAYVGLANAYEKLGSVLGGAPPKETHPKMMSAARKAIELDPDLAEPHVLLAEVYQKQWQWSEAEAEFKRALELNSNDAGAHVGYAKWLLCQGRTDQALAWVQRARELDPLGRRWHHSGWNARHHEWFHFVSCETLRRGHQGIAKRQPGPSVSGDGPDCQRTTGGSDYGAGEGAWHRPESRRNGRAGSSLFACWAAKGSPSPG